MPENISTYTSMGFTIFMAVVLLFGFLLGIIRGWKKSTLRFGIFVGVSVVVLLFMPLILKVSIENITINGQSLQQYAASLIESNFPETAKVVAGAITGASALALAAIGSIVFLGLFILIQILTWIIFGICKLFLRKNKTAKKHRFIGGLIGLVQGLFVCFVFMIPIAGFTDIAYNVADAVEVVITEMQETEEPGATPGEETGDPTVQPTASLLAEEGGVTDGTEGGTTDNNTGSTEQQPAKKDYTNALKTIGEIKKVAKTYRKSMPGAIYGIGKLDVATFNYLSQAKVGNTTVKLSKEVDSLVGAVKTVAGDFDLSIMLDFKNKEQLKTYLNTVEENQELKNGERLFKILADVLFDSDVVKAFMVDGINNLSADTETVLNGLTPERKTELSLEAEVKIERISVSKINWTNEKTTFSKIMNNVLVAVLDYMDATDNQSPESSGTTDIENLPLEKIGEALDGLKEMEILKNIFNPGLKRLISVEKLIKATGEQNPDGTTSTETTSKDKTISEYVLENTKFTDTSSGINLDEIKDYNEVVFADLMSSIKKAAALKKKMDSGKLEVGVGSDIAEVIADLSSLPPELKTQLNDLVVEAVGDQKVFGDKSLNDLGLKDVDIFECAPIIGSMVDVASTLNVSDGGELKLDDINKVVNSFENIVNVFNELPDGTGEGETNQKQAISNLVANTINTVVGGETPLVAADEVTTVVSDLASDKAMVDVLLKTNFASAEVEKPTTETIVNAVKDSKVVSDMLVGANLKEVFTVPTTDQAKVEEMLAGREDLIALFKFADQQ